MVIDYSRFENIDSDLEDDDCHPNIDKKSWNKWRREQNKQLKDDKTTRLGYLLGLNNRTDAEDREVKELERDLKPKMIETSSSSSTYVSKKDVDYTEELFYLLENNSIQSFLQFIGERNIIIDELEELVLLNLTDKIKNNETEVGIALARIALCLKYFKMNGRRFISHMVDAFKENEREQMFEDDVLAYYDECKEAILSINND